MELDTYNLLVNILNEFKQEKNTLDEKLRHNFCCIKEAEVYSETYLKNKPEEAVKVFSPRNIISDYKNKIDDINKTISQYEEENELFLQKKNLLSSRIESIENILKEENDNLTVRLSLQEEDRKRIARDLHDVPLQNLTHLIHQIELSGLYIDEDPIRAKLELSVVNKRLKETIDEIRNIIFDIRPLTFDDLGLKSALERLVDSFNEEKKYEVELDIEDVSCETNLFLVTIYRIIQECLNNILKHADATKISLSCKCKDNICYISISDNGRGFIMNVDDGKNHFGLYSMKERIKILHGNIHIDSFPDKGTSILIDIPLVQYSPDSC